MSRYERELTNFNIGAIGYRNDDSSALGIVIANTLNYLLDTGEEYSLNNEDNIVREENLRLSLSSVCVKYETENRCYAHMDFLDPVECTKGLLLLSLDGAILVVNALEGITSDIGEQLSLANMAGIRYLVVFVDNCDLIDDEGQLEQLEDEIRELFDTSGYFGEDAVIVYGSAKGAQQDPDSEWGDKILELMEMIDECMPDPEADRDRPFLMPVEDVFTITGRGTVATGRVETGVVKVNDRIEVLGFDACNRMATVTGIEMFRKLMDFAEPGDSIGLLLRGVDKSEVKRGHVIVRVRTCKCSTEFTAVVHFTEKKALELMKGQTELEFGLRTALVPGMLSVSDDTINGSGQYAEVTVKLSESIAMDPGQFFVVNDAFRRVLGIGKIMEVL